MNTFPNGVYGINLTKLLQGTTSEIGLLQEITNRFEEFDQEVGGDGVSVGEIVFREFFNRLDLALDKKGIRIPTPSESENEGQLVFRIHQIDHHAEINDSEGFDPGDLILGIGILGFPNKIKFSPRFIDFSSWHLWTIDG